MNLTDIQSQLVMQISTTLEAARFTEGIAAMSFDEVVQKAISEIEDDPLQSTGRPGKLASLENLKTNFDQLVDALTSSAGVTL